MGSVSQLDAGRGRPGPDEALLARAHTRVVPAARLGPTGPAFSYAWRIADGLREVLCVPKPDGSLSYLGAAQLRGFGEAAVDRLRAAGRAHTAAAPIETVERRNRRTGEYLALSGSSPFIGSKIVDPVAMTAGHLDTLDPSLPAPDGSDWLLVGAPTAHLLLVHRPSSMRSFLTAMHAMAQDCQQLCAQRPAPISADLHLWRPEELCPIIRADPETGEPAVTDPDLFESVLRRLRR